jgi:hypothetical protein
MALATGKALLARDPRETLPIDARAPHLLAVVFGEAMVRSIRNICPSILL